eukprot:15450-Heterococcus_DN1.PRE.1
MSLCDFYSRDVICLSLIICCCVLRCCNSLGTGVWPGKHAAVRNSLQAAEVKLDSVQLIDTASLSKLVLPSMNSSNSAAVAVARSTAADVPGSVVAVAPRKWYSPSKKYVVSLQEDQHLFIYLAAPPNTVVWQTFIFYSDVTSEVKLLLMPDDGNLLITAGGSTMWQTGTASVANTGATLLTSDDGSSGLYRPDNTDVPYWTTSSTIQRNAVIAENINVYSPNRAYVLLLQGDSNLVIYDATVPRTVAAATWSSINDINQPPRAATF